MTSEEMLSARNQLIISLYTLALDNKEGPQFMIKRKLVDLSVF